MTKKKYAKTLAKLKKIVLSHLTNFSNDEINSFIKASIEECPSSYDIIMKLIAMCEVSIKKYIGDDLSEYEQTKS